MSPEQRHAAAPAPTTPPSDLAQGPPEKQSEPTPPPKEETKPIEQEAEVALPIPEPPKPEPPVEEREANAAPSVEMPPSAAAPPTTGAAVQTQAAFIRWQSALAAHFERFKRGARIVFSEHTDESGATVFEHACRYGFEGIVSKRLSGLTARARRGTESRSRTRTERPSLPAGGE